MLFLRRVLKTNVRTHLFKLQDTAATNNINYPLIIGHSS